MERNHSIPSFLKRYQPSIMLLVFGVLQALIICAAFMTGFFVHEMPFMDSVHQKSKFSLLSESLRLLEDNSIKPLPDEKKLEYGMIRGMLQELNDPFTVFVEPPQHELQTNQLEGKFGGIGVRIDRDVERNVYLYPLPDSPAIRAGVQEGDRLISVEGISITADISDSEIQAAVRGPVGENVRIIVGHAPDYEPVELEIERAEVALPSITWNISPIETKVGVVQVHVIADTTADEVTRAIQDLRQRGATHFIMDLRNNGGGLVEAGVNTARLFLKNGIVIQQQYRGKDIKTFNVEKPGALSDIPLVILVNKGTASAAEIFTGALQGQKRAMVVGTRTYGKDTIQLVFSLADGSSLHVTAAQWWVPGLKPTIGGNGLQPDVEVDQNSDPNAALQVAIQTVLR